MISSTREVVFPPESVCAVALNRFAPDALEGLDYGGDPVPGADPGRFYHFP